MISQAATRTEGPDISKATRVIASKLAYEWKNIYRQLSSNEAYPRGRGQVTLETFKEALTVHNVRLTNAEISCIAQQFKLPDQRGEGRLNYQLMSHGLGLHTSKLNLIQASVAGLSKPATAASGARSRLKITY